MTIFNNNRKRWVTSGSIDYIEDDDHTFEANIRYPFDAEGVINYYYKVGYDSHVDKMYLYCRREVVWY